MNFKPQRAVYFASLFVLLTTLLWQRNLKHTAIATVLTFIGTSGSLIWAEKERQQQAQTEKQQLQQELSKLRREQQELQAYVNEAFQVEQDISASVRALKSERQNLLNRISNLHNQRNHIAATVEQLKQENEAQATLRQATQQELALLKQQHQQLESKLEAHAALDALAPEVRLNRLQNRLAQVRRKLASQQQQQQQLQGELAIAQDQKLELEGALYDLRTELNVLQQRYDEIQENLRLSQAEYREISFDILGGKAAVNRLFAEIQQKRQEKAVLTAEIEGLEGLSPISKDSLLLDLLPPAWQAWLSFIQHLTPEEQQFLKVILTQEDLATLSEFSVATKEPVETLEKMLHQQAMLFLGESPFVRVGDRPLPQLKAQYHSLLSQSLLLPKTDGRLDSPST